MSEGIGIGKLPFQTPLGCPPGLVKQRYYPALGAPSINEAAPSTVTQSWSWGSQAAIQKKSIFRSTVT